MTVNQALLEAYLKDLRLHTFVQYHQAFAQDAAQNQQSEPAKDAGTTDSGGQEGGSPGGQEKQGEAEEEPDC